MKKLYIIIITLVLCIPFVVCKNSTHIVSEIAYTQTEGGTEMKVDISPMEKNIFGSEFWLKGEEIVFKLKSQKDIKIEIGICPIDANGQSNDNEIVSQIVDISDTEQKIPLTVPKDSQYRLVFSNKTNKYISFNAFINRIFSEPLV